MEAIPVDVALGSFRVNVLTVGKAVSYTHLDVYKRQPLFLLGCYLAILVLAVEHMTFVDMGCAFIQMQRPVQHMNVFAKLGLEMCIRDRSGGSQADQ